MPVCWVVRGSAKTLGLVALCSRDTGDTDLIVVGAVCGLLHRRVFLIIAHLHTHHGVHVQAYKLPSLDHCDADLWEGEGAA